MIFLASRLCHWCCAGNIYNYTENLLGAYHTINLTGRCTMKRFDKR